MVPLLDSREVMYVTRPSIISANPDLIYGSNSNKVRMIALYIQYREGVPDEDRRRLYQHARLTRPEMDAVNALVHLGVRIGRVRPAYALCPQSTHNMRGPGPDGQGH
jgi:syntaxin-binding protein 1